MDLRVFGKALNTKMGAQAFTQSPSKKEPFL
jgi:hypothetical protein